MLHRNTAINTHTLRAVRVYVCIGVLRCVFMIPVVLNVNSRTAYHNVVDAGRCAEPCGCASVTSDISIIAHTIGYVSTSERSAVMHPFNKSQWKSWFLQSSMVHLKIVPLIGILLP